MEQKSSSATEFRHIVNRCCFKPWYLGKVCYTSVENRKRLSSAAAAAPSQSQVHTSLATTSCPSLVFLAPRCQPNHPAQLAVFSPFLIQLKCRGQALGPLSFTFSCLSPHSLQCTHLAQLHSWLKPSLFSSPSLEQPKQAGEKHGHPEWCPLILPGPPPVSS